MLEKIKSNFTNIVIVGCIVALIMYSFGTISMLGNTLNDRNIVNLCVRASVFVPLGIILFSTITNKVNKNTYVVSLILVLAGYILTYGYELISATSNSTIFTYLPYIALYGTALVLFIVSLTNNNKNLALALQIVLGTIGGIVLLSVVGSGNMANTSVLILLLIINGGLYFGKDEKVEGEKGNE